jgi:hypothetical protein
LIGALAAITTVGQPSAASEAPGVAPTSDEEAYLEQEEVAAAPERNYELRITNDELPSAPAPNSSFVIRNSVSLKASPADASTIDVEATDMSDEQKGRDPNSFTGTRDAVDPETGALGTAGTPVTTGYGVSGSTVGTGSRRRRKKEEKDHFRGSTPDTMSYDVGGRATGDAGVLQGAEREASVVDRNSDAGRVEASIPRETEGRDVYEQSEGYVENLERDTFPPVETDGTQESAGTNIPGTGDPRDMGDNTDMEK